MKEYIIYPIMTPATLNLPSTLDKPAVVRSVPARQPLPTATIDPTKTLLKLGMDVHLDFSMVVRQTGHGALTTPRKFTRTELVAQVSKWSAEGYQVFCVQESCGFGFTLHRELVAAGAQSFMITPIALNGVRKIAKLDARALYRNSGMVAGGYTLTTYTSMGQPQLRRNLDGTTNQWRYTLDGRVQQEILPNGSRWGFVYDDANRRVNKYFTNAAEAH